MVILPKSIFKKFRSGTSQTMKSIIKRSSHILIFTQYGQTTPHIATKIVLQFGKSINIEHRTSMGGDEDKR